MAEKINVLQAIQTELKAPKGQFNKFGNYKYRSCEDILEAVKPILAKYGANLILTDDIQMIGERFYVRATAVLRVGDDVIGNTTAFAREPEDKKGMDASQITGTASSYARKYALNGLLLIDDTKDEDSNELHEEKIAKEEQKAVTSQPQKKTTNKDKNPKAPEVGVKPEAEMAKPTDKVDEIQLRAMRTRIKNAAAKGKRLDESDLCKMFKIEKLEDMTYELLLKFNALMDKAGV